jgi:hypothetical protein
MRFWEFLLSLNFGLVGNDSDFALQMPKLLRMFGNWLKIQNNPHQPDKTASKPPIIPPTR